MRVILSVLIGLIFCDSAHAWNALGHKVIADIAWQTIDQPTRERIVATLRRHPRFDEDFAKRMPAEVDDDARWVFQHAATWPDLARGLPAGARGEYDRPTWHYINVPLFVGGERPLLGVNLSTDYPSPLDAKKWNVAQAVRHCQATLADKDASPTDKALAYCWLLHLVGDLHQPLHSTALFTERFPTGDRGGNSIKTVQGENLHSLWDNLLGKSHKPNNVKRIVAELGSRPLLRKVDAKAEVEAWIRESHDLAKSFVYSPQIIDAVQQPGELQPVNLPREYLEGAGEHARAQVVAAGLRLGSMLRDPSAKPVKQSEPPAAIAKAAPPPVQSPTPAPPKATSTPSLTHWLNLHGDVRHNSECEHFENTKRGRACSATEGKPCGICGG